MCVCGGRRLRHRGEGRRGGLQATAERHGHPVLHSGRAERRVQAAVLRPTPGERLLPATSGRPLRRARALLRARAGKLVLKMQFVSRLADNDNVDRGRGIMNASENVCLLVVLMVFVGLPPSLQAEGQEVASVVSAHEIRVAAELLQVSPEGLQKSVTFKMTVGLQYDAAP